MFSRSKYYSPRFRLLWDLAEGRRSFLETTVKKESTPPEEKTEEESSNWYIYHHNLKTNKVTFTMC